MVAQHVCISFKLELLQAIHSISNSFYICLFDDKQKVDRFIESYNDLKNELIEADGYKKGGQQLKNPIIFLEDEIVVLNFDSVYWENCSISAKGALIYNNSAPNKNSVAVIDFGIVKSCNADRFVLEFPNSKENKGFLKIV